MPVFENLMKRLGFVNLRKFGLMLTDEGRVVSTRDILDDDGTPVVGWRDADLAATQLPKWGTAKPQPAPLESRISAQMKAVLSAPPAAEEPEEDWEWHIALARARAAAEEAETAAQSFVRAPEVPRTAPGRKDPNETQRGKKNQPKRAEQMPVVAPAKPRLALVKSEPAAPPLAKPTLALVRDTTAVTPPPKPERAKRQDDVLNAPRGQAKPDIATARSAPATSPTSPMRAVTKTSPMVAAVPERTAVTKAVRAPSPEIVAKRTERFETQEPDIIEETAFAPDQTVVGLGVGEKTDVIDNQRTTGRQRIARGTPDPAAAEENTQVTLPPAKPTKTALPSITQQMARR